MTSPARSKPRGWSFLEQRYRWAQRRWVWCIAIFLATALLVVGGQSLSQCSLASPTPPEVSATTLQPGSQGPLVATLQRQLKELGYDPGAVDGVFGPVTESAGRTWQAAQNLSVDGVVDADAWSKLQQPVPWERYGLQLEPLTSPSFSPLILTVADPPPSHLWLVAMPLIPLMGGALTYLQRQLTRLSPGQRTKP